MGGVNMFNIDGRNFKVKIWSDWYAFEEKESA
nr:MAG TPA: hypothetical protein [Caudoviricetes sp.]DAX02694.1 MAG TPA: hypothetical protein [Bacteriophage sp.]